MHASFHWLEVAVVRPTVNIASALYNGVLTSFEICRQFEEQSRSAQHPDWVFTGTTQPSGELEAALATPCPALVWQSTS